MYVTMGTSKQNIQGNEQIESHYYFKYYSKVFTTGQAKCVNTFVTTHMAFLSLVLSLIWPCTKLIVRYS